MFRTVSISVLGAFFLSVIISSCGFFENKKNQRRGDGGRRIYVNGKIDALLVGTETNNTLTGTTGNDIIRGLGGNDTLSGELGDDVMFGGDGNDTLKGRDGNDTMYGGANDDYLEGGNGDDIFNGGLGIDTMKGGSGRDTFIFTSILDAGDTIQDYNRTAIERIDISAILELYDPLVHAITDFVQITTVGANSVLAVDADGGANNFVTLATILNVINLTDEQALVNSGHLVV